MGVNSKDKYLLETTDRLDAIIAAIAGSGGGGTAADEAATPTVLLKTVASSGTPEAIVAVDTYCKTAIICAVKAYAATANADTIYFGSSANQTVPIFTEGIFTLDPIPGKKYNLKDIYVRVLTNGDGIVITYW